MFTGGVPDPCETRSIVVPSEQCDKRSWDIGAEFILPGVRLSRRACKGSPSPSDGGTVFLFSILWTAAAAFPGVLFRVFVPVSMLLPNFAGVLLLQ